MFFRRKKKKDAVEAESRPDELRERYRRIPAKNHALSVQLNRPSGDPLPGEVIDVSAGGAAILFVQDRDPNLTPEQVVVLAFSSLVHGGEIIVHARVVRIHPFAEGGRRYGFEFVGVDALFEQLDTFYFNFFNRRRVVRVRPALDTRLKVQVAWDDAAFEVLANDVAVRGLGLVVPNADSKKLIGTTELLVSFSLPKSNFDIECPARIAHRTDLSKEKLIGISFSTADTPDFKPIQDELRSYVDKREKDMARWDSAFG